MVYIGVFARISIEIETWPATGGGYGGLSATGVPPRLGAELEDLVRKSRPELIATHAIALDAILAPKNGRPLGVLIDAALAGRHIAPGPTRDQSQAGLLFCRAMIEAARGARLLFAPQRAGIRQAIAAEPEYCRSVIDALLYGQNDIEALARSVPPGFEPAVYAVSVLATAPDDRRSKSYLRGLAGILGLGNPWIDAFHTGRRIPQILR